MEKKKKIIAKNGPYLDKLIKDEIDLHGLNCDLNHIDVSRITNMYCLFSRSKFNGDISKWDVSKVEYMNFMFKDSEFRGDISNWNVSNVVDMHEIFSENHPDIPYWAKIEDREQRKKAVQNYLLSKKLDSELNESNDKKKKNKI